MSLNPSQPRQPEMVIINTHLASLVVGIGLVEIGLMEVGLVEMGLEYCGDDPCYWMSRSTSSALCSPVWVLDTSKSV